ncbi:MAG: CYTH domain-containing protein [Bacteroidaceae bacterium]|nr:CYTH domain-containing protein [Bacteroidaceae bacterium]
MALEIERKFLVKGDAYKDVAFNSSHIVQGYICGHPTVRVRLRDDKGYLTIKGGSNDGGLSRYEFETEIPLADALAMLRLCSLGMVDKTRWLVDAGDGHTFEVDEFHGSNEGLVVAEVELAAPDEPYVRLDFLGQEVTGIKRYYNSHLRKYPYSAWSQEEKSGDI